MEQLLEKYSSIPPLQRLALVGAVIAVLCAAYYYFIYTDQTVTVARLEKEYNDKAKKRDDKAKVARNKSTYEEKLGVLQEQLDQARAQLPDSADVPQLLAQLGNRARDSGLDIEEFNPADEKSKDFYAEIAFRMKVRGSYHEIALFIDSVGKLDRIINIVNLEMTNPDMQAAKVVVNSTFDVKTYRFLQQSGN
jgi:type IV pilus assembly protein PilO